MEEERGWGCYWSILLLLLQQLHGEVRIGPNMGRAFERETIIRLGGFCF